MNAPEHKPRIRPDFHLKRGYYIADSNNPNYYLYDDGKWRITVKAEGKNAFWPTSEAAIQFLANLYLVQKQNDVTTLSDRERSLMKQSFDAGTDRHYDNFEHWMNDIISHGGHTVEQYISYCDHNWVSADNAIVSGCVICTKCKRIASADKYKAQSGCKKCGGIEFERQIPPVDNPYKVSFECSNCGEKLTHLPPIEER